MATSLRVRRKVAPEAQWWVNNAAACLDSSFRWNDIAFGVEWLWQRHCVLDTIKGTDWHIILSTHPPSYF